jgi:iron-sulfur cluster assembly protein
MAIKAKELVDEYGYMGVRIAIKGGGCAGFEYDLSLASKTDQYDNVFESHGVKIYCDKRSYLFLNGTEIGYKSDLMNSGFTFKNPNAGQSCGCGTSFSPKSEDPKKE